jgi:CRP/FNR family transcriptional regulator, cyclic AMP receptor protein
MAARRQLQVESATRLARLEHKSMLTQSESSSSCWPEAITSNHWFAALSVDHQTALMAVTRRVLLRDGQAFTSKDQNVRKRRDGFAVLVSGLLRISSTEPGGREALLGFVRPGQWFGELALLDGLSRERDISSVGASELLVVEPEDFKALMEDGSFSRHVFALLGARLRLLLALVEDFKLRSARARTARRLLLLAYDDDIAGHVVRRQIDVAQDQLASMLGLTRQSVATQLRALAQSGAISQAYGRVLIESVPKLYAQATKA